MFDPSLSYEVLMYLNSFYFGMFASCELGMGLLKAINLPYKGHKLAQETSILVCLCLLETARIILGRKGALIDRDWHVIASVFLTFPSIGGVVYLLCFQIHPLLFEYVLCGLMLALQLTEIYFCIAFLFTMCKPVTYD